LLIADWIYPSRRVVPLNLEVEEGEEVELPEHLSEPGLVVEPVLYQCHVDDRQPYEASTFPEEIH